MQSPFTKKYFERNRIRLREKVSADLPIILSSNNQLQYSADSAYPFRQDTNFWYITGVDSPDIIYVHDGQKETLILPKPNIVRDVFDGVVDQEYLREFSGIERIISHKQGSLLLKQLVQKHSQIATLLPATGLQTHYGIVPNPSRKQIVNRLRRLKAGLTFTHLGLVFAQLRMVKSKEELKALKSSINLTVEAFNKAKQFVKVGMFEYEIEAVMTSYFRMHNAKHAYPPIIAGGKRACTLHYDSNDKKLASSSLVLLDVGAEQFRGAADITRTYTTGKPTKRQIAVHQSVIEIQKYAFSILKPGVLMHDYEKLVEQETGRHLKNLGLIKHASRKQIRKFFPHASSHFLGLDVHDSADYSKPLEAGMVLTVEPGIYIPDESIGIRIEDDVLITETGIEVLSEALPRHL